MVRKDDEVFFVEVKTTYSQIRPEQMKVMNGLRLKGYKVFVFTVDGIEFDVKHGET